MKTNLIYLLLGGIFLAGCSSNKSDERADVLNAPADSVSVEPMLVKTADIRFKVADAVKSSSKISSVTRQLGGIVMHNELISSVNGTNSVPVAEDSVLLVTSSSANVNMTVRIPTRNIETFVESVVGLASHIETRITNIEDRSFDYLANELRRENREKATPEKAEKTGVWLKDQPGLEVNDEKADLLVNNLRTRADVAYSTVSLAFYQDNLISKERIANPDIDSYRVNFMRGIWLSIRQGWWAFETVIIALVNLWVPILMAAAGWWLWRKFGRKQPAKVATTAI